MSFNGHRITLEEQMVAAATQAAWDDSDFQLYLKNSYTKEQQEGLKQGSVIATLHHAYLAGKEVGKMERDRLPMKTPRTLRTKY